MAAVSISDASVTEGVPNVIVLVTRTDPSTSFTVTVTPADGTATSSQDYLGFASGVTFTPGGPLQLELTINLLDDNLVEPSETFTVNLTDIINEIGTTVIDRGSGVVTIFDNDVAPPPAEVWVNEIHYDNSGTDAGEFIEVAGTSGIDLSGYSLYLYNGVGGSPYDIMSLSGIIPNQQNGFGTVGFDYAVNGIQNGSPDGIALVGPGGLIQFLSYEGAFVGVGGPANGVLSTDIGVLEPGDVAGQSLQLTGTGSLYSDFTWSAQQAQTEGQVNTGQSFPVVGVNVINGTPGNDLALNGTAGADQINGFAGNDVISAMSGDDVLNGSAGVDTMAGGLGNDVYVVDVGGDVTTELAGEGIDKVNSAVTRTLGANIENLQLTGTGAISGFGNALNNQLIGNTNNNALDGLGGNDAMLGGQGNDTYFVDSAADTVSELLNEGTDQIRTTVSYTLSGNVENMTLLGAAAIDGTGNSLNNLITGNSAANTLDGKGGSDGLFGGDGNDIYVVDNAGDSVVESVNQGTDTVRSSINYALTANVENLELQFAFNTNAFGNTLDNILTGNAGNNLLDGGIGADTMAGGAGNDQYVVDNAGDVVTELPGEGIDQTRASITYTLTANVEKLQLQGSANIDGTGNDLDNQIVGNSGNNFIDGGIGADVMFGGAGNDTYVYDSATDAVGELVGEGTDTIRSFVNLALPGNVEILQLQGIGSINGFGNALANIVEGNSGSNVVGGGAGNDTLTGGDGADSFFFGTALNAATNVDQITDFVVADDTIRLENAVFTQLATPGALAADNFALNTPGDGNDFTIYDSVTGALVYDADGNGAGTATKFATLATGLPITNNDFFIV